MNTFKVLLHATTKGERGFLAPEGNSINGAFIETGLPVPRLRAGEVLCLDGKPLYKVFSSAWLLSTHNPTGQRHYFVEAMDDVSAGRAELTIEKNGPSLAWITLSDKGSRGERTDESGPLIADMVGETLNLSLIKGFVLPDVEEELRALLTHLALEAGFDLILTTGGTGVAPRDVTPEATLAVIEKRLPGFERAMTAASLEKTPHGAISRAVAGTLGDSIIVNMPGSPKAVKECLEPLLPVFRHTIEKLQGDQSDCATLRQD